LEGQTSENDEDLDNIGYKTVTADLMQDSKKTGSVLVKGTLSDFDVNDPVIFWAASVDDDEPQLQGIYDFRIGDETSIEEIVEIFGTPTESEDNIVLYIHEAPYKKYLEFVLLEGKLEYLYIGNNEEEA
jgi:hypothetical protein